MARCWWVWGLSGVNLAISFSTFSYETITLFRDGQFMLALGNIGVTIALCLLAVWLGYELGYRR